MRLCLIRFSWCYFQDEMIETQIIYGLMMFNFILFFFIIYVIYLFILSVPDPDSEAGKIQLCLFSKVRVYLLNPNPNSVGKKAHKGWLESIARIRNMERERDKIFPICHYVIIVITSIMSSSRLVLSSWSTFVSLSSLLSSQVSTDREYKLSKQV